MKQISKTLLFVGLVVCFFVGWWIAQDNAAEVVVTLLGFPVAPYPLGGWLIVMLSIGILLGMLASAPLILQSKSANRKLKKQRNV